MMSCKIKNYKKKREENKLEYLNKKQNVISLASLPLQKVRKRLYQ